MRLLVALLVLLLAVPAAHAQTVITTGPVTTADKAEWTIVDAPATTAQAFEPRFAIDSLGVIVPTGTACTGTIPAVKCTANLTAAMVTALNAPGSHNVTLKVYDATTGIESSATIPFVWKSGPAAPTGLRLTR